MWKINHTSFDSGFTTLDYPRNREEALEAWEFWKAKGFSNCLLTLYRPCGRKVRDYYSETKKETDYEEDD
ncbi:MAG: hypothetical protein UT24_C0003G0016 [Candidatus Woesebacteria bacterium GW2011_GWB1_39_12]|uniref:Uncharacterized protein n=1 Tax=Candidatus Woesebacteria bacterium GW2011_GWB1_39_12 TaxID=1618574 RepID=A0A0G0MC63_9BACT|nr:MAG: hypothetical protein UT24_C0003G0016 [Candidatus Woesebacteria bacterium GW2011_GWB1_39_12]